MTSSPISKLIRDDTLRGAIGKLFPRSERAPDPETLVATFVDNGIIELVDNTKNQIIYGRRGTGKTHVLGVLESRFGENPAMIVVNVDLRTLGSSTMFADQGRPLHARFIGLYKDLIGILHNALFERAMDGTAKDVDAALNGLDEVERQMLNAESETEARRIRSTATDETHSSAGIGATIAATGPSLTASLGAQSSTSGELQIESAQELAPKIIFPSLYAAIDSTIAALGLDRVVLLIDEWSSIPIDLQPFLAELFNRAVFPNKKITVKIASLEFRSRFMLTDGQGRKLAGLELGGDIETAVDLDDFYVYDKDPDGTETLFADLLLRHLIAALDDPTHLEKTYGIRTGGELTYELFTEQAFTELVRAAEGVARDFLQVFARAFTTAYRSSSARITVSAVSAAAQDWYESDKQTNLGAEQHELLRSLIENVIGSRQARSFMVAREYTSAPLLRSLIDQRVVHVIRKGYADKDNPGIRYNIYTLDYGCYVDLKKTKGEPEFVIEDSVADKLESAGEIVVPFDDRRRIRRIIVPPDLLQPSA